MDTYTVWYRLKGERRWNKLKNVVGHKYSGVLWDIKLKDKSLYVFPDTTALRFSKELHYIQLRLAEQKAGQKIPVKE